MSCFPEYVALSQRWWPFQESSQRIQPTSSKLCYSRLSSYICILFVESVGIPWKLLHRFNEQVHESWWRFSSDTENAGGVSKTRRSAVQHLVIHKNKNLSISYTIIKCNNEMPGQGSKVAAGLSHRQGTLWARPRAAGPGP